MTGPVQFDKSILDRYPYPLARPARELEHAETPEAQLRQLEIMAEMTVRYLGCIALANYLRDGVRVVRIQHLLNRLDSPEWDIWLDLLSSLLQHYSAEPSEFVAQELIATYNTPIGPETDIFKACQFLAENANLTIGVTHKPTHVTLEDLFMLLAEMHKAGWSGRDASKWVQVCFPAFAELLKRLSCLQNYPLAYLANVEVTEKKIEYHLDVYMGSSDSAQRKDVSNLPEGVYLDPQQVYLCDANLLPLLGLHPLLIVVAQKLHILYQNRNDEQIIYVQCGTLSPYQPESPGYSIGGMALGGGDVKTMTQSMRPLDLLERYILPVRQIDQVPQPGTITSSDQPKRYSSSVQSRGVPDIDADSMQILKRLDGGLAEGVGARGAPPSVHWLEFQMSGYLGQVGLIFEDITAGSILGPYRILSKMGEGAVAVTYGAEPLRSLIPEHRLVLRILKQRVVDQVLDQKVSRALLRWRQLSQQHSPNVLGLNEIVRTRDNRFILELEHFDGVPLTSRLRGAPDSTLAVPQALNIAIQVCRALAAAHKIGLAHGHIKPSNILICDKDGLRVKVTDFCVSDKVYPYLLEENLISAEDISYLPPEILKGEQQPGALADIYAVGVLLYRMLAGQSPYAGDSVEECKSRILAGEYIPIRAIDPTVPLKLERVIRRAMHSESYKRYQRVDTLLRELEDLERSRDAVDAVSDLLLEYVPTGDLDRFLDTRGIPDGDRKIRVIQYCLQEESLEEVIDFWFGFPQLRRISEEKKWGDVYLPSGAQYIVFFMEKMGIRIPSRPEGIPQYVERLKEFRSQLYSAKTSEQIRGLVSSAAVVCEAVLRNLIQFHATFLFQDAYQECLLREVLGEGQRKRLKGGQWDKITLGNLFEIVNSFNKFVEGTSLEATWFQTTFQSKLIVDLPDRWQRIAYLRNEFLHYSLELSRKHITQLRSMAKELVDMCLDLLSRLQNTRLYPRVVVIREMVVDYYGRRSIRCLCDDGDTYTVYTGLDLKPGQRFFLYAQSEPITIDPILIPFES